MRKLVNNTKRVRLVAAGDVILGRSIGRLIKRHGHDHPLKYVSSFLNTKDLLAVNLESPVTTKGRPVVKPITLNSHPRSLPTLKSPGIDLVSLSNNHTLDYGRTGLIETMKHLRSHGISFVGAGRNAREAHIPLIIQKNGLKIAFLSYSAFPYEGVRYDQSRANIARGRDSSVIRKDIQQIRAKVDLVIVFFHWGREFNSKPTALQRVLARATIDAGADLIIGHHPHVIQPPIYYRGKLILFSLGDFLFDHPRSKRSEGIIFSCDLTPAGVSNAELTPIKAHNHLPKLSGTSRKIQTIKSS